MNAYLLLKRKLKTNTPTRFDPLLLNWAIVLLAKTSHSNYEEIAQVMQIPPLSYVLRKTRKWLALRTC